MKMKDYIDYIVEQTCNILEIDSPTGFTSEAVDYVCEAYRQLGYEPELTVKGGILVEAGEIYAEGESAGENISSDGLLLEAHLDTLGAMVAEVKANGRLRVSPLGGMNPNNGEGENCRVYTRDGTVYEGTFQLENASIHVNDDYNGAKRGYDNMEVVLDEKTAGKEETLKLGILPGDIVAFEPRTRLTESGYLKSRFLDDKLSVGILLGLAKWMKEEKIAPARRLYHHITVYEEVGHGASGTVPADVAEILSVDMGCVGDGLGCTERQVSICAKDSAGPYNYDVVGGLVQAARKARADFAIDVYPHYGSDADAALTAGHDVKHGLIGAGVYASHGYERTHLEGIAGTFRLLCQYAGGAVPTEE